MFDYGLGGQEVPKDASEAISDIPMNRTLMIEKLTADSTGKPEVVQGLKTIEEVFQHFKPHVGLEFQKEDGTFLNEELRFGNLGDFGTNGITNQSTFLQDLLQQKEDYAKLIKQLKSNKNLNKAIETPEYKQAFIVALQSMLQEIEDVK
ncbi:MAG: type VI secretion system contractile sheath small subunit [Chitinophagaceae bacterium]|nr:type VI secretion system contractile sheath small subunit [Chitinophagaceae bacterium]